MEFLSAHDSLQCRHHCLTKTPTGFKAYRELWVCPIWVGIFLSFSLEPPGPRFGGGICFPSSTYKHEDGARCSLCLFSVLFLGSLNSAAVLSLCVVSKALPGISLFGIPFLVILTLFIHHVMGRQSLIFYLPLKVCRKNKE